MHASTKRWDRGRILEVRYGGPTRILVDALSVSHLQFFAPEDPWLFFGRDRDTAELLTAMKRERTST